MSIHWLEANVNLSKSSIPDEGVTKNVPDVGGELETTTRDDEVDSWLFSSVQMRVNVSVAPTGTELDRNTKLNWAGDEDEAKSDETDTFSGINEDEARSKELSSTDHTAKASSEPLPANATDAVRKSLLDGSILGVLTLDRIEAICGKEGLILWSVMTSWLDLTRKLSSMVSVI